MRLSPDREPTRTELDLIEQFGAENPDEVIQSDRRSQFTDRGDARFRVMLFSEMSGADARLLERGDRRLDLIG